MASASTSVSTTTFNIDYLPLNYFIGKQVQRDDGSWNLSLFTKTNINSITSSAKIEYQQYYSEMTFEQLNAIRQNIVSKINNSEFKLSKTCLNTHEYNYWTRKIIILKNNISNLDKFLVSKK
jgi:hypothetical protein